MGAEAREDTEKRGMEKKTGVDEEIPSIPSSSEKKSQMRRTEKKKERNIVKSGGEVEEKTRVVRNRQLPHVKEHKARRGKGNMWHVLSLPQVWP